MNTHNQIVITKPTFQTRETRLSAQAGFKSNYIAILIFTNFKFYRTKIENLKHVFSGELYFYSTDDLDLDNIPQIITSQLKTLSNKIDLLPTLPFCYIHCLRFVSNVIGIKILI